MYICPLPIFSFCFCIPDVFPSFLSSPFPTAVNNAANPGKGANGRFGYTGPCIADMRSQKCRHACVIDFWIKSCGGYQFSCLLYFFPVLHIFLLYHFLPTPLRGLSNSTERDNVTYPGHRIVYHFLPTPLRGLSNSTERDNVTYPGHRIVSPESLSVKSLSLCPSPLVSLSFPLFTRIVTEHSHCTSVLCVE